MHTPVIRNFLLQLQVPLLLSLNSFAASAKEMAKKCAIVLLAEGGEEMEFVISVDVLRRAGISVTVAGLNGTNPVKCSRDVLIVPDSSLEVAMKKGPYDVVVLPGGLGGAKAFASITPTALKTHSVGLGKQLTSYPVFKDDLKADYKYSDDKVVIDDNLLTSRGPATAFDFALAIVEKLLGKEARVSTAKPMLLDI